MPTDEQNLTSFDDGRRVLAVSNHDLAVALSGRPIVCSTTDGEDIVLRLMTVAEAEHAMKTSGEKFDVPPPAEGYRFHAERLTRPLK